MADTKAISSNNKSTTSTSKTKTSSAQLSALIADSVKSIGKMPIVGAIVAEFIGAFLLTAVFTTVSGQPLYVGFALIGVVLIIGTVSGAHVNPAMTIGALVTRRIGLVRAIGYIAAQVLGAVIAYMVLDIFIKGNQSSTAQALAGSGPQLFQAGVIVKDKEWFIFLAEMIGSIILAFGVATSIRNHRDKVTASFSQGFAILIALVVMGSATAVFGTGLTFLNPAIAFAANGLSWNVWPIAIYVIAPIIGAVVGFAVQNFLRMHSELAKN